MAFVRGAPQNARSVAAQSPIRMLRSGVDYLRVGADERCFRPPPSRPIGAGGKPTEFVSLAREGRLVRIAHSSANSLTEPESAGAVARPVTLAAGPGLGGGDAEQRGDRCSRWHGEKAGGAAASSRPCAGLLEHDRRSRNGG